MDKLSIVGLSFILLGCNGVFEINTVEQSLDSIPIPTAKQECFIKNNSNDVLWVLNSEKSYLEYLTTKEEHIVELNQFKSIDSDSEALNSSIDSLGNVVLDIDLNKIKTEIEIRDVRMRDIVFETGSLPKAYLSFLIDPYIINGMTSCTSTYLDIEATLSLHGVNQNIVTEVLILKHSDKQFSVVSVNPVIVNSDDFDLTYGVNILKTIANLNSISLSVPVYFQLNYIASQELTATGVEKPYAPLPVNQLTASYDTGDTSEIDLKWDDNSEDEDGFIVRQKIKGGAWHTVRHLMEDDASFSLNVSEKEERDFKVITIRKGVASESSKVVSVKVNEESSMTN